MQIVLPGALPEPAAARELFKHVSYTAPTLSRWLEQAHVSVQEVDIRTAGCTAYEYWLLEAAQFKRLPHQNMAAGLAPLRSEANYHDATPIWLAELVHVAPSRDGAVLLPAHEIQINPQQSVALFESAHALFEGTGFMLHPDGAGQWRVTPPSDFTPHCASPALVSISTVNDWWPQDLSARPWRRLFNELQMVWFTHPVNLQRQAEGLPAINGLWLYGGAASHQISDAVSRASRRVIDALERPSQRQDWGDWLNVMSQLERDVFSPLMRDAAAPGLVLVGRDRILTATPSRLKRWTQWLPGSRHTWRKWWSHQN